MKFRTNLIYCAVSLGTLLGLVSCIDNALFDDNSKFSYSGNEILFNVTSGFGNNGEPTRSNDREELDPLIYTDGQDTLYLHRYVAREVERTTGKTPVNTTRAIQIKDLKDFYTLNGNDGFKVKADYTDGDEYFPLSTAMPYSDGNTHPSGQEDVWFVNPYKYWPGKKELCFNAFAPASAESLLKDLNMTKDGITFNYTVPVTAATQEIKRDAEVQPDIMFATQIWSHYDKNGHVGDLAPLNFRHALSAIKFEVRDVTKWNIVDISIKGVYGSGHCQYTVADNFKWDKYSDVTNYTQTFNYETTDKYPNTPEAGNSGTPVIEDRPIINKPEETFMLIPQVIPDDAILEITLETIPENAGDPKETKTLSGKLSTSEISEWLPGKEYVYTISTTAINWTYVFDVVGSVEQDKTFNETTGKWEDGIFEDAIDENGIGYNRIEIDASVNSGSYYKVRSYRKRTNNPSVIEAVPWNAEASDGSNVEPTIEQFPKDKYPTLTEGKITTIRNLFREYEEVIPENTLNRPDWLVKNWVYSGEGSSLDEETGKIPYEEYRQLHFAQQYIATDWGGDWQLRTNNENGSASSPIDLSTVYGSRNTANCYLVNAGGWYSIPLYYGNAIKNGSTNIFSYENIENSIASDGRTYKSLYKFKDYLGQDITTPNITTSVKDAVLVWQDAPNIIDQIRYDSNKGIVFHVRKSDLQQSNSIVAIRDGDNKIIWSWHIWVSEHWVNNFLKLGDGDVVCDTWNNEQGTFTISPYNLGWCDPKNIYTLKREGEIIFTQNNSGNEISLPIIQRPEYVEYWIGNNTYYQFGRKDPLVGFINNENKLKYNFGDYTYRQEPISDGRTLGEGIQLPNVMFTGTKYPDGTINDNTRDWVKGHYYNLWNNYRGTDILEEGVITQTINNVYVGSGNPILSKKYAYSATKTIYDPSPVGYVVPPTNVFKLFSKGIAMPANDDMLRKCNIQPNNFNGTITPISGTTGIPDAQYYRNYMARTGNNGSGSLAVKFYVTGQRFWLTGSQLHNNQTMVYAWSNTNAFFQWIGYGLALGYDDTASRYFNINAYFPAGKSMGRPVRCIKEFE